MAARKLRLVIHVELWADDAMLDEVQREEPYSRGIPAYHLGSRAMQSVRFLLDDLLKANGDAMGVTRVDPTTGYR